MRRLGILLGLALLAAPARADLLADALAGDVAVEKEVHGLLVQALLGDPAATEAQVFVLEDLDERRKKSGFVRTGLTDDGRYLAASLWLTRDARRRALQHVLDGHPDETVRRLAEHRLEADDASTADRLLADDRHNRRATLVNGAVRPLGIFSGAAFLAALNPFIMAGSAVDSAVTTAVNLWHYNRLSTPEREALARYRRQLDREPRTQDAPEIAEAIRRLGAKRAAALCDDTIERATTALDDDDLDHAAFYVRAAAALDGCAERSEEPARRLARAQAQRAEREDAGRWPVDDPPRAASTDEARDHETVLQAVALGEPQAVLDATAAFRERHRKSPFLPATELSRAMALDLAGRRPEARDVLADLADDDGSAGRCAEGILASAEFTRLDAIRSAENRHARETARFVLLGPPNGRSALYSAAQLGAEGVRAAESIGIFNVIGVATRAWQAWRRDPISNQEIIDRGEEFLAREPASEDVPEVHERLADAYERAEQYPRALMHYRLAKDPDADRIADLEGKVAEHLLTDAQKRGNDRVLLTGIVEKFPETEAAEKARELLDERREDGELVLARDVLLEHPALLGPDALDLDPRLLDGEGDNGELADGGVTLAPGELRLALRADGTADERVETRALEPQPYSRARAAAQEVLYTRLLTTSDANPDAGRYERYLPFFLSGTVDPGGGLYVYPGLKTRKYQSEDRRLYE
jgi:hypothetical protein